jgi:hypothetical protein
MNKDFFMNNRPPNSTSSTTDTGNTTTTKPTKLNEKDLKHFNAKLGKIDYIYNRFSIYHQNIEVLMAYSKAIYNSLAILFKIILNCYYSLFHIPYFTDYKTLRTIRRTLIFKH